MIQFPTTYPFKITNATGSPLCGISAGQTITIGPSDIAQTITFYNSYAELAMDSLINGNLTATDLNDTPINGNQAATAFSNARASVIEYQNISSVQQKNVSVSEYIKLNPLTTAERNVLPQEDGLQIFNSDTGQLETYNNSQWDNSKGPQGDAGANGAQGDAGANGPQGDAGANGPQGDAGANGPQGDAGANGAQGDDGAAGPQGDAGAQGPQGVAGGGGGGSSAEQATFDIALITTTQSVSQLTWSTIFIPRSTMTITSLSCLSTQAGSGNTRMGIYNSAQTTLLAQTENSTSLSTGLNTLNLVSSYEVTAGTIYYLAIQSRANGAILAGHASTNTNNPQIARRDVNNASDPGSGMSSSVSGSATGDVVWISAGV